MTSTARKTAAKRPPTRSPAAARVQTKRVEPTPDRSPRISKISKTSSSELAEPRSRSGRGRGFIKRKRSKQTNEWLTAGALFVGLMAAVIVGIHLIGGAQSSAASSGASRSAGGRTFPNGFGAGGQNAAVLTAVASALGISSTTLSSDLQAGETVSQIAAAQHVPIATVNSAYLSAAEQRFTQAVSSGFVTQAQANQLYTEQQQQVQTGNYSLLESARNLATPTPVT